MKNQNQIIGKNSRKNSPSQELGDIKPFMVEFAPRGPVYQPAWASDLMRHYW